MQLPLQISLHGIRRSNALYERIREKAAKLDHYSERVISCHVALELAGKHKHLGKEFAVRIDLKVPGGEIAVTRKHDEDIQIALRKAFDAARRKLEDHVRKQRGDTKQRSGWPSVRLGRLLD
jgi:ribosomal subunit interface protein